MEIAVGDALKPETLSKALQGVDCAYYLIHSMAGPSGFEKLDLQAARNFGIAAKKAGVNRIIYLGGLGDPQDDLSPHLRSRQETGQALRKSGVPVTEFRAAVIVGSGSISFEMIRHLVERLPIIVCPKWIYSRIQPIAIDDILAYLVSALNKPKSVDRTIEIGGADVITYRGLMLGYARARGLRRLLIPAPVLSPRLSPSLLLLSTLDDPHSRQDHLRPRRGTPQRRCRHQQPLQDPVPSRSASGLLFRHRRRHPRPGPRTYRHFLERRRGRPRRR